MVRRGLRLITERELQERGQEAPPLTGFALEDLVAFAFEGEHAGEDPTVTLAMDDGQILQVGLTDDVMQMLQQEQPTPNVPVDLPEQENDPLAFAPSPPPPSPPPRRRRRRRSSSPNKTSKRLRKQMR